jgi:quercetin dioxygenase-like cupin family protein
MSSSADAAQAPTVVEFDDIRLSPTAWLFEGARHGGAGISSFIVRTPPGSAVELHTHPYPETFVLLEGRGRWTAGDDVVEVEAPRIIVVPPQTPHGFRNVGEQPLLVVSVHEAEVVDQTFLGRDPA